MNCITPHNKGNMSKLKDKIVNHAKTEYSSSPYEFDDEQIQLIIEHDCECDHCGKSIFELNDFPCVSIERKEVLCEDCYDEEYRTTCPICEESWEIDEMTDYFFISKSNSKEVGKPSGIYKILERPFYYGDCVTGFDAFFDGAIQKVSDIDIEEVYSILHPRINKENITLDCMCPHCAEKYLRKDNFIRADSLYCILQEKQRNQMFADYSDERIHRLRQDMIHRRITFRGLLQLHNK